MQCTQFGYEIWHTREIKRALLKKVPDKRKTAKSPTNSDRAFLKITT
jgi:hypothetical protein